MSNYNSLSGFKVDGSVESSVQGKLLGSFTTMPTADASNLGATVLYQGATTASYTQGSLYKCVMEVVEGINTYRWDKVNVTSIPVEDTIVQSDNPISSGAVYDADFASNSDLVQGLAGKIDKGTDAADIAAREAALESGITSAKVNQYDGYATSKFNVADFHTVGGNYGSNNPVTTEEFVNSSVATNTANFKGSFSITGTGTDGLGLPSDATATQIATALDTKIGSVATNNDYAFAYLDAGSAGGVAKYDRYKYSGTYGSGGAWGFEYTLNNSSFTSQQWDAINSTITAAKVTTYDAYATGKQDKLVIGTNMDSAPASGSNNPVTSGGVFSAINNLDSKCVHLGTAQNPVNEAIYGVKTYSQYIDGVARKTIEIPAINQTQIDNGTIFYKVSGFQRSASKIMLEGYSRNDYVKIQIGIGGFAGNEAVDTKNTFIRTDAKRRIFYGRDANGIYLFISGISSSTNTPMSGSTMVISYMADVYNGTSSELYNNLVVDTTTPVTLAYIQSLAYYNEITNSNYNSVNNTFTGDNTFKTPSLMLDKAIGFKAGSATDYLEIVRASEDREMHIELFSSSYKADIVVTLFSSNWSVAGGFGQIVKNTVALTFDSVITDNGNGTISLWVKSSGAFCAYVRHNKNWRNNFGIENGYTTPNAISTTDPRTAAARYKNVTINQVVIQ